MNTRVRVVFYALMILLLALLSAFSVIPARADDGAPPPPPAALAAPSADNSAAAAPPAPADNAADAPAPSAPGDNTPVDAAPSAPADAPSGPTDAAPAAPASDIAPTDAAPIDPAPTAAVPTDIAPTDVAPTDVAPTDAAPTDITPRDAVPTDVAPVDAPPATDAAANLSQVPSGTDVVVVNAAGDSVPLVSEEASDIISNGDPIWCPATVTTPVNGGSGCSSSFGSLKEVVDYLTSNPKSVAGIIWISKSYDSSVNDSGIVNFTLDGSSLGTTSNYALTLKGGWNDLGTNTVTTTDPSVFNGASLSILNWKADVTLSDIEVTGITTLNNALDVQTSGNITLTRVNVHDNAGGGAYLYNTSGPQSGTSKVTITSSQFNANHYPYADGLLVYSWGSITLSNVTASSNAAYGAILNNCPNGSDDCYLQISKQPITLTGVNQFNNNGSDGLNISTCGMAALAGVTANNNSFTGLNVSASGAATLANITANGNSSGDWLLVHDYYGGLKVSSDGAVSLANITANSNGTLAAGTYSGFGASLYNINSDVTLTGTNQFDNNWSTGLMISAFGHISISGVTATDNGLTLANSTVGYGVNLNNCTYNCTTKNVTVNGINNFSNNYNTGLYVSSKGGIIINNLTASGNMHGYGAYLDNCAYNEEYTVCTNSASLAVTITNSVFAYNGYDGLRVWSGGNITVNNITADSNGTDASRPSAEDPSDYYRILTTDGTGKGAYLNNYGATTPKAIALSGITANDNADAGLFLETYGSLTTSNITANNNGHDCTGDPSWVCSGMYVDNSASITLTGANNTFNSNRNDGIDANSWGPISVSNVHADGNVEWGAGIFGNGSLTLLGVNSFTNNGYVGLDAQSATSITLNNITATGNGAHDPNVNDGVYLDTCFYGDTTAGACDVTGKPISLLGNNTFSGNYGNGLEVNGSGSITLTNVIANNNGGEGAILKNGFSNASGGINVNNTPTYSSSLSNNGDSGLVVYSRGAITISNLTASSNSGVGATLDNCLLNSGTSRCDAKTAQPVTLTGTNTFNNNGTDGLDIYGLGNISASSLTANHNTGGYGAWLKNAYQNASGVNSTGTIVLTGNNTFNNNYYDGLDAISNSAISTNSLKADANGTSNTNLGDDNRGSVGAWLENDNVGAAAVTMTGTNEFNGNYAAYWNGTSYDPSAGLVILSRGAITANNLTANNNAAGSGAILNNCAETGPGTGTCTWTTAPNITVTGLNAFNGNHVTGLEIYSRGTVTTNNVTAANNATGWGEYIENYYVGAVGGIAVNGTNTFTGNWWDGLAVFSHGAITVNNVTSIGNALSGDSDSYGIDAENNYAGTPQPFTMTGTNNLSNNLGGGSLYVISKGAITINNLTANGNTHGSGAIINNTPSTVATPQAVTFTGLNQFSSNYYDGLKISTYGVVSLAGITANGNGMLASGNIYGYGVYVDNRGNLTLLPDVNATGINQFSNNWLDGIDIFTNGNISLASVTALNNGLTLADSHFGFGAYLENCNLSSGHCTNLTAKVVTLSGVNNLSNNYNTGLYVSSKGAITVNDVTANYNGGYGANLNNKNTGFVQPVTVNGGLFYGNSLNNGTVNGQLAYGLNIQSNGVAKYVSGPMWCPVGATPGAASCSHKFYPNLEALAADAGSGFIPNVAGVIWIQNSTFGSTGAILFDGTGGWSLWSGYALTLQGGWSGLGTTVTTGTPSVIQDPLSITGWTADITLNDIVITGVTGTGSTALTLTTTKNIKLTRVNIHDNAGAGADLENGYTGGTGAVTLTTDGFSYNVNGRGLYVYSKGMITLSDIDAIGNGNDGAFLNNTLGTLGVTMTGTNVFSENADDGLKVYTNGAISASNLIADENLGRGAWLDNCKAYLDLVNDDCTTVTVLPVTLTGSSEFKFNDGGLRIVSNGAITTNNITASNNFPNSGVWITNDLTSAGSIVTMNGANVFNDNGDSGIVVNSRGIITFYNVTANGNGSNHIHGCGAELYNNYSTLPKAVNLNVSGSNPDTAFFNNYSGGLVIDSLGAITLTGVDAENNLHGDGAYLDNNYPNAVGGIIFSGSGGVFNNNGGYGLEVYSKGAITATSLWGLGNGSSGVMLNNTFGTGGVTLGTTASNAYISFGNNGGDGLDIYSKGVITLYNLNTDNNGGNGAKFDNTTSGSASPQNVILNGYGNINNNGDSGLVILSYGLITVNNLNSNNNGQNNFKQGNPSLIDPTSGWGVYLDNCSFVWGSNSCTSLAAPKGITLNGTNTFNGNFQDGLWVTSLGPIVSMQLHADSNGGDGAYLDNQWARGAGGISVTSYTSIDWNRFTNNGDGYSNGWTNGDGLEINSNGAITLNNIWARDNGSTGASVDNGDHFGSYAAATPQNVTITGQNWFTNNGQDGLDVIADGNISISNVLAYQNQGTDGTWLDNCLWDSGAGACAGHGGITLTGVNSFNNNSKGTGLDVDSHGNIILNNVTADNNGAEGVFGGADGTILVSCGSMNNNKSYGWEFQSWLTVTLKSVFAYSNKGGGSGNTLLDNGTLVVSRNCP